jgi:chemotaxis protein methyltransferase CheR
MWRWLGLDQSNKIFEYPGDFKKLLREIAKNTGLNLVGYRNSYLKRRIGVRIKANRLNSYDEYIEFLKKNPTEYEKLLDRLTVNVTEFFRNPSTFEAFRRKVLPALKSRRDIRIWSAGCASGEEPYSIAIIVSEFFGKELEKRFIKIYATDIDNMCLSRAFKGEYEAKKMVNVDVEMLSKYFIRVGKKFVVKPEIKRMVFFEKQDILKRRWINFFDVVFCRNVAIYFSRDSLEILYRNLYDSLRNGGFLITGKVESIIGDIKNYFEVVDNREHIYRAVK